MLRTVVFGALSVASITAAGWLYQAYHLVPLNFDFWPAIKTIRDVGGVSVALVWLFYPSRVIVALAMASVCVLPVFTSLNPPDLLYFAVSTASVGLAVLATHVRRGIPSPFTTRGVSSPE